MGEQNLKKEQMRALEGTLRVTSFPVKTPEKTAGNPNFRSLSVAPPPQIPLENLLLTIWKIWKKSKSNSDKIWTIWKKSKWNSEKIGKIWKKGKLNSEKI